MVPIIAWLLGVPLSIILLWMLFFKSNTERTESNRVLKNPESVIPDSLGNGAATRYLVGNPVYLKSMTFGEWLK